MIEKVILINNHDEVIGEEEKIKAHRNALLHRAFSVFVLSGANVLLQKRQLSKYHCGGLWTNAACGHPRPSEKTIAAAKRRLEEEMGFVVDLKEVGSFHYVAKFSNGLTENEIDHVFVGDYDGEEIAPNTGEVAGYKWVKISELKMDLQNHPDEYTPWLKQALEKI